MNRTTDFPLTGPRQRTAAHELDHPVSAMNFNLQQLTAFTTIVSAGSLGRAASTLNVSQPALSRSMGRLEQYIGAPLFERHTKGMQLTDLGQALLPHAIAMQRQAQHAREELDAVRGLAKGVVKVGAVASIASLVLPMAVGRLLDKWPNLRVEVIEGVWDRLVEGLLTYEVDLALCTKGLNADDVTAISDCTWTDNSRIVAALDHPLRKIKSLRLQDTLTARWVMTPKGTGPYSHLKEVFEMHGVPLPDVTVETRSVTSIKGLVARCGFVSWMAEPMFEIERGAGIIDALEISGLETPRTLTAFRRSHGILPTSTAKLLDELRQLTGVLSKA